MYFLARKLSPEGGDTLIRMEIPGVYSEAPANLKMKIYDFGGKINEYQLSGEVVYFTLRDKRFIGSSKYSVGLMTGVYETTAFDDTDGHLYKVYYSELTNDHPGYSEAYYYSGNPIDNWTVIGDYIYCDYYTFGMQGPLNDGSYKEGWAISGQARIRMSDGETVIFKPKDWVLDTSPDDKFSWWPF